MTGQVKGVQRASSEELLENNGAEPSNIPKDVKELGELANNISLRKQNLENLLQDTQKQLDQAEAEIKSVFQGLYAGKPIAESASHEMQSRINAKRREILEQNSKERYDLVREIGEMRKAANGCSKSYESPATMLRTFGLSSPERVAAVQNVQSLPDAALATAAGEAIRTGDKYLASALIVRLEALSGQQRQALGISPDAFARNFTEADYVKANGLLAIAKNEENNAIRANRDLERGRSIPAEKIKAGLDAGFGSPEYKAAHGSDETLNKISRGIESYYNHGLKGPTRKL